MKRYLAVWEMDIEAESALDAARQAHTAVRRDGSIANVYKISVWGGTETMVIDLDDHPEEVDITSTKKPRGFHREITNNKRASWANTALSAFVNETAFGPQDDEEMMGDMLSNIRHLADAQGWDIEKMWASATANYREEIDEQPKADADFAEGEDNG